LSQEVALGIRVLQGPQQHALDDGEDGRVGADAEGKRQHRNQRHAGGLEKLAHGKP